MAAAKRILMCRLMAAKVSLATKPGASAEQKSEVLKIMDSHFDIAADEFESISSKVSDCNFQPTHIAEVMECLLRQVSASASRRKGAIFHPALINYFTKIEK